MAVSQIRQNQQIYLRNMALLAIFAGEIAKRRQKIIFAVGVRGEPSFFICVLNPVKYTDPDGRAAGEEFDTMDKAAIDFGMTYNDDSIRNKREYGTKIRLNENGKYVYDVPHVSETEDFVTTVFEFNGRDRDVVASAHTHGASYNKVLPGGITIQPSNQHSPGDKAIADKDNLPMYTANPNGALLLYIPSSKGQFIISEQLPSDSKSAQRKNSIDAAKLSSDPSITQKEHLRKYGL
jgi:hypothetical protein